MPAGGRWESYANARYAYSICYPAQLLVPQGEADNGDGQTFRASGGAELRVFGSNNALEETLAQAAARQSRYLTGARGKVTYRAAGRGWSVASGSDGKDMLFYAKTLERDDQFVSFTLRYPQAQAARYKAVVERTARCFHLAKHEG